MNLLQLTSCQYLQKGERRKIRKKKNVKPTYSFEGQCVQISLNTNMQDHRISPERIDLKASQTLCPG